MPAADFGSKKLTRNESVSTSDLFFILNLWADLSTLEFPVQNRKPPIRRPTDLRPTSNVSVASRSCQSVIEYVKQTLNASSDR